MPAVVNAAEATGRQAASERPVASLAVWAVRKRTGVALPPAVAGACFDLFGLHSAKGQLAFVARVLLVPNAGMRRLRQRARQSIADYRQIVAAAPHLAPIMKLDFTILLGLYQEAVGIRQEQAVSDGLVEAYCHLAALIDAYDDLLDTAEARRQPLAATDFLTGEPGRLRERLLAFLRRAGEDRPGVRTLVDDLACFESQALHAHLALDIGTGLTAPLPAVVRARAATSGLLLRFAAHMWSVLLGLPDDLAASSENAAATFGLVAQFADDVIDWSQDDGVTQNLLGAALHEHPDELAAARACAARHPGCSVSYATLRRQAPCSLRRLEAVRREAACYPTDSRYAGLRQFSDDVYYALLPALPAVDFRRLDAIRGDVQDALSRGASAR